MKALSVSIGSATSKGKKAINQDFLGHQIPAEPLLTTRGVALAIADGISSSPVSQAASETAVTSFLEDYYRTSEAWSVKTSGEKVLKSINAVLFFKQYNDTYGHASGDEALQKIAMMLSHTIQNSTNLIARYGGEEFVAILPNKTAKESNLVAQNIMQAIRLANIKHRMSDISDRITISIGIATRTKGESSDIDTLMKKADIALYYSKNQGRNQSTHIDDIEEMKDN